MALAARLSMRYINTNSPLGSNVKGVRASWLRPSLLPLQEIDVSVRVSVGDLSMLAVLCLVK